MEDFRKILAGSARTAAPGAKIVSKTDPNSRIEVTVILSRKAELPKEYLQRHAEAHPALKPVADHGSFAESYGASDEAVSAVQAFAANHGLTVVSVDRRARIVKLAGRVSDMEQAFGSTLHDYATETHRYRGRQGPILLPTTLTDHVEAVLGLDNRPVAKPRFRSRAAQVAYYPNELAALYGFPSGDGAGQTIAIIELGGNYDLGDLRTYFAAAGLAAAPSVQTVSVSGDVPVPYGQDQNSDGEVMLDIEVVGGMAPGATIVVYFASNTDQGFYEAVSRAVHDPATTAVSISWGSAEKSWTQQTMNAWASLGQTAAMLNVPIFVAAGDHGCADETPNDEGYDGQRHADFPATCPMGIIACGGTSLLSANGAISRETVWNDGDGWATGGGVSTVYQVPDWQRSCVAEGGAALLMRGIPDVAGDADVNTGIRVRVDGTDSVSGGTSAVAPQWAALTAILAEQMGKKPGFFLPLLYSQAGAGATRDIISGDNSVFGVAGYVATAGWNACTGLGSPNGAQLLALFSTRAPAIAQGGAATVPPAVSVPPSASSPTGVTAKAPKPFDPAAAVLFGQFVEAAYTMYEADPTHLTPPPSSNFPAGYRLSAWIQMQDFVIEETGPTFYGFIAQNQADLTQFVLVIRGTQGAIEWWDDVNALVKQPFKGPGYGDVGSGFLRIYQTLEVVERPLSTAASPQPKSMRTLGGFAAQVAALVQSHATLALGARLAPSASIVVAGHSLGAALATLYALDNAVDANIANPLLCTFASPRVGDSAFVAAFSNLGLTSWRIVNLRDLVPMLPPEPFGFAHVETEQPFDSAGKVQPTVACWHSLATYLSLIDPALLPDPECRSDASAPALRAIRELTQAAPVVPLWWESDQHPERKEWSSHLHALVAGELFFTFDQAEDATRIRADYHSLGHGERATVWCEFICGISRFESDWNPLSRMQEPSLGVDPVTGRPAWSEGLLQLSYQDTKNYPWLKSRISWEADSGLAPDDPKKTILDPLINLEAGARILAHQIARRGKAILQHGVYWSTIQNGGTHDRSAQIIAQVNRLRFPAAGVAAAGAKTLAAPSATPWLDQMRLYVGQPCPTGKPPTPWIIETFSHTNFGPLHGVTPAACAATLCRVLDDTGYASTHSAAAISYENYGTPCDLKSGAILVFQWPSGDHHVTLCDQVLDDQQVKCLGGNQDHLVKDSVYPIDDIVATRWPTKN